MLQMTIKDVFFIRGRGVVAAGRIESGELRVGDAVQGQSAGVHQDDPIN